VQSQAQDEEKGLEAYLGNVSLVSDIDNLDGENDHVVLMTLHSAKGLEFPVVFIPGFEEGVFPGLRSMGSDDEIEEERRLCYVGITRARERLFLISANSRTLFGNTTYNKCSRFMKEIPEELLDIKGRCEKVPDTFLSWKERTGTGVHSGYGAGVSIVGVSGSTGSSAGKSGFSSNTEFKAGDNVVHKKFGIGKISSVTLDKGDHMLEIEFRNAGMRRLMASFANLVKL